jgi:hypothetical protein
MPKFLAGCHCNEEENLPTLENKYRILAGCHCNEEEISRHLKRNIGYWPVQIHGNKFAPDQILKKPVEVVKVWILAG